MTKSGLTEALKQPAVVGVAAFIFGLLIGLPVLGWWLFPVAWTDADFGSLRSDLKQEYVRLVANSYAVDGDLPKANQRVSAVGANWRGVLDQAIYGSQGPDSLRLIQLKDALAARSAADAGPAAAAPGTASAAGGIAGVVLPLGAAFVVVVVMVGGAVLFLRSRRAAGAGPARPAPRPAVEQPGEASPMPAEAFSPTLASVGAQPIQRFLSTYTLGDDVYDDSFSIDGPEGSFLGECGVGISETIGVGDPKKVTAFEVWLFDKNDIRTVTKVLMSDHAFRDDALKGRLAAKGEPVAAAPGDTITLETAALVVTARVVDMSYGGGALPPSSFFARMTVELQAFRKPGAA